VAFASSPYDGPGIIVQRGAAHMFVSAVAFLLTFIFINPALAECPRFPDVPWWKGLSHDSVRKYVAAKHDGDWNAYVDKWEKQLEKVRDVYSRGAVIVIPSEKLRLHDEQLQAYIKNIKKRLSVIRCLAGIGTPEQAASPPPEKAQSVSRNDAAAGGATAKSSGCGRCHGEAGMSEHPAAPNLAGQNDLYLIKQIKEFKALPIEDGVPLGATERHNRLMAGRVKKLSDAEIWNLAAFYSSRPCGSSKFQADPMKNAPPAALACTQCHGMLGKSVFPEVPNLAGQNRYYLVRQLTAFRNTAKNAKDLGKDWRYHYIMAEQARNLTDPEIEELSSFFSGLSCR